MRPNKNKEFALKRNKKSDKEMQEIDCDGFKLNIAERVIEKDVQNIIKKSISYCKHHPSTHIYLR